MDQKIRTFLAIDLSEELYQSLKHIRQQLESPRFDVRWVSSRNIHMTLRFFGEISVLDIQRVSVAIEMAVGTVSPFEMVIQGLGAFPAIKSPRVIWAGTQNPENLMHLEEKVSSELTAGGWPPPDKPFRPHLTLGRVKSARGKQELKKRIEENKGVTLGRLWVDHISLIKSDLQPSGPIYTPLNRFSFADTPNETVS